jgi:serine/threonine protein kinase
MSENDKLPFSSPLPSTRPDDGATKGQDPSTVAEAGNGIQARLESTEPLVPPRVEVVEAIAHVRLEPSDWPPSLGRIGHYEVLSVLGRGAMGVVVRGYDTQLCRTVAIKVMSPQLTTSAQARERFVREARAAAGINHPNIVTIHAVSEQAGVPYLVMEYVGGRTLMDRIRSEAPLKTVDILRISAQIAGGLAAAHQQGIIHRDIKPANIMLEDSVERVKITDFGLARVMLEQSDLTSQGGLVGTPAYMSPEQVNGEPLDRRSDLFSLGCVMYAMTAGHSPFRGENALGTARRVTSQKHVSLAEISREVPAFFVQIVDRLLEKNRGDRYPSAGALLDELTRHLARLNIGADSRADPPLEKAAKQRKRGWLALGALSLAVIGAILAGSWALTRGRKANTARVGLVSTTPLETSVLRVAKFGQADFTSLAEALRHAPPGCTIRVEDSAVYDEPVKLVVSSGLAGGRLEAPSGATLKANGDRPVLTIDSAARVKISGFHIEAAAGQHAIEMRGLCVGTIVENCQIGCAPDSPVAAVYLHAGARGTQADPIVLSSLRIRCGGVGVVVGGLGDTEPVSHVLVTDSVIQGPSHEYGIPLVLQVGAKDVSVRRNLFSTGLGGISLSFDNPRRASDVVITQNSLANFHYAFTLNESSPDQGIRVADNLIIEADTVQVGAVGIDSFAAWFAGNWWERSINLEESVADRTAKVTDPLPLLSRDPESPLYLKPAEPSVPMPGRYAAPPGPD